MGKGANRRGRRQKEKEAKARQRTQRVEVKASVATASRDRYFLQSGAELLGPDIASAKYASLSESTKARVLIERVQELFDPALVEGRMRLRRPPTPDTVRVIAEELVHLWPKGIVPRPVAPLNSGLRALYWGRRVPSTLATAITRASLYCDNILVLNPFIDDMIYHPEHSPLVRPDVWVDVVASNALYVSLLKPWIDAGIVGLVTNPAMTNPAIREQSASEVKRYLESIGADFDELVKNHSLENFAESIFHLPTDQTTQILNAWQPTAQDRARIEEDIARFRKSDPVLCEYATTVGRQILKTGTGANSYTISVLAAETKSIVVTDAGHCASILRMQKDPVARPEIISRAFSRLPLSFLNAVPPEFAVRIRKEGRLVGFRKFLEEAATLAMDPTTNAENRINDCVLRVTDEYEKYKKEWAQIQRQLLKEAAVDTAIFGSLPSVLTGTLSLTGLAAGLVTGQLKSLVSGISKRRALQRKPLGMIFDLERHSRMPVP